MNPFRRSAVVRVALGYRLYAYKCRGARVGSLIEVDSPVLGRVFRVVEEEGRGGYHGRLKRAQLIAERAPFTQGDEPEWTR